MTDFYLWLDFETTGLDPRDTTILEAGWTVTDESFLQLTPLRSRFSRIATGHDPIFPTSVGGGWTGALPQVVRDMHTSSKLRAEWLGQPEWRILSQEGLDRLLLDDLFIAGFRPRADTLFLAGAGVSHYDRLVIEEAGILRNAEKNKDEARASFLHYRAADTSAALQVLGIKGPKTAEDLAALAGLAGLSLVEAYRLLTDETTRSLVSDDLVVLNRLTGHRAAPDVAFALVVGRALKALVQEKLAVV